MDETTDQGQAGRPDASQRERRRQRHEGSRPRVPLGRRLRPYLVPVVIVLLWGSAVSYTVASSGKEAECPGHWMAVFQVTLNDQVGSFSEVTRPTAGVESHGGDQVVHFEGPVVRCTGLQDTLAAFGVDLGRDSIQVEPGHNLPTERFASNATHELRTYLQPWAGAWERRDVADMLDYQLKEGERVLVTYTALNASVDDDQARTPPIADEYRPVVSKARFPVAPVAAFTTFAALGLVLWRTLVKKAR